MKSAVSVAAPALLAQIEAGTSPIILDVRSRAEYVTGHVPGALHFPFWTLPFRAAGIPASRMQPVVVYCGHGPRAWWATMALRLRGFRRVMYLRGHMAKWQQTGFPRQISDR